MFEFVEASLKILPLFALFAAVVAVVGHLFGKGGAIAICFVLLLVASVSFALTWHSDFEVRQLATLVFVLTGISALFIALPMFILARQRWLRERLIAGLVGALAAAFASPIIALLASCTILGDCL